MGTLWAEVTKAILKGKLNRVIGNTESAYFRKVYDLPKYT